MPAPDVAQLLRPGYWFTGSTGPATPYTYVVLGVFVVALALSLFVWLRRRQVFSGQRIKIRLAARLGPWFVGVSVTGLFFVLLRVVESPILTGRILWALCLAGLLGLAGYVAWYMARRYPIEQTRVEREEMRQRFMPKPRGGRRKERRRR